MDKLEAPIINPNDQSEAYADLKDSASQFFYQTEELSCFLLHPI